MTMNINKTLSFFIFSLFSITISAQPMNRLYREANKVFNNENYCEGAEKCENAYKQLSRKGKKAKKYKGDMAFKTGECYRLTEHYKDAQEWYDRALLLDFQETDPKVLLYNAAMLQQMGEFKKAIDNLNLYKQIVPNDILADVRIRSCQNAKDFKAEKTRYLVENQRSINKPSFDMAPVFGDRKESKLFFSSSRAGSTGSGTDPRSCENYMDIWVSQTDKKGNWGEPTLLEGEGINSEDNEGTVCFDGRNKTMFFTRCPNVKKMNLGCDIWMSEAKGRDDWKEPTKLVLKSSDSVSVGHPCASDDGRTLVFTSDMAGGYGGHDLWISIYDRKSDSWSGPKNLGPEVNTSGDEMFATFAKNGDLFFASNGHPGLGNLDIFRAAKVGEEFKWENAQNMGFPINSEAADYALYEFSEIKGYFTSERKGENGEYKGDIYSYELPPNLFDIRLSLSELGNRSEVVSNAKVVVTGSDGSNWEGYTNDKGKIAWEKKPNGDRYINQDVSYVVKVAKEGFHEDPKGSKFTTVGLTQGQTILLDMALLPKKPIRLPEVRYPLAKATLLVDSAINSKDSLNFVLDLLNEYPGMVLELSSHTDARGSDPANQKLSEARAQTCVDYLVKEKGVDPRRLKAVGKGEREPAEWKNPETGRKILLTEIYINQFKTTDKTKFELLHQVNRRTEGKVLSMDFIK
jgi:outer membrane protein OmpA-like peptidoglycan-associated protein